MHGARQRLIAALDSDQMLEEQVCASLVVARPNIPQGRGTFCIARRFWTDAELGAEGSVVFTDSACFFGFNSSANLRSIDDEESAHCHERYEVDREQASAQPSGHSACWDRSWKANS